MGMSQELAEAIKESEFVRVFSELIRYHGNHRSEVLIANGFCEMLVQALVEAKCSQAKKIISGRAVYTYSVRLLVLHEMGVIDRGRYDQLVWFCKVRDEFAHLPFFEVTKDRLHGFPGQVPEVPGWDEIHALCITMVATLWTDHHAIFAPKFAKGFTNIPSADTSESDE